MNEIKILFFVLGSFFGIEDGRIAADKITVHIYPQEQEMEIVQEHLFALIQSEKDKAFVLEQWDSIYNWQEKKTPWAKALDDFPIKDLKFTPVKMTTQTHQVLIRPHLILKYDQEDDLSCMGIWFNSEKDEFYLNHVPEYNIKSENGKLEGNYWVFSAKDNITFTMNPFLNRNDAFQDLKVPLKELVRNQKE